MAKQPGKTWWGERFLQALDDCIDSGRLRRGRAYASDHRILKFDIAADGTVSATVRGNINPYFGVTKEPRYRVRFRLTPIPAPIWKRIVAQIGARAALVTRLLMHEMPDNIDQVLADSGRALLPRDAEDFQRSECSCPDYANPCKHIAGVYYRLAARLDEDPLLLFELRGLSRAALHEALRKTPLGMALAQVSEAPSAAPVSAERLYPRPRLDAVAPDPEAFWRGREPLPTDDPEPSGAATVSAILVKKGGDCPPFWDRNDSFIGLMEEFYRRVREQHKKLP